MFSRIAITILLGLGLALPMATAAELSADPTRPPDHRSSGSNKNARKVAPLRLDSTLISPQRTVAIINGLSLTQGDRIRGYRVLTIEPNRVELAKGKQNKILRILPRRVKVPAGVKGAVK